MTKYLKLRQHSYGTRREGGFKCLKFEVSSWRSLHRDLNIWKDFLLNPFYNPHQMVVVWVSPQNVCSRLCEDNCRAMLIVISIMIVSNQWYWQVSIRSASAIIIIICQQKIISSTSLDFTSISKSDTGKIAGDVNMNHYQPNLHYRETRSR